MGTPKNKEQDPELLFFGTSNSKLKESKIASFSIPAGHTCPGACQCLAKRVVDDAGRPRIWNGPQQEFRCYAASMEVAFPNVAESSSNNWEMLKAHRTVESMAGFIDRSLSKNFRRIGWNTLRVHTSGDFYSASYFMAWMEAARRHPEYVFYAYTKSVKILLEHRSLVPENFRIVVSLGGKWDDLALAHCERTAVVVFSPEEAEEKGLQIDKTEMLALDPRIKQFALLLHGTQGKGTRAAAAKKAMEQRKIKFSYGRK